jgi:hypothetical protein
MHRLLKFPIKKSHKNATKEKSKVVVKNAVPYAWQSLEFLV